MSKRKIINYNDYAGYLYSLCSLLSEEFFEAKEKHAYEDGGYGEGYIYTFTQFWLIMRAYAKKLKVNENEINFFLKQEKYHEAAFGLLSAEDKKYKEFLFAIGQEACKLGKASKKIYRKNFQDSFNSGYEMGWIRIISLMSQHTITFLLTNKDVGITIRDKEFL
jgi:hypothetical protein